MNEKLKTLLKIIATNWIHLLGFYITTYLSSIFFKLLGIGNSEGYEWEVILFLSLLTIPLLFFTYGVRIIGGFFGGIILLDLIGFNLKILQLRLILLIECLIIIPLFINWAFEYNYWLWLTLSGSFIVTQFLREQMIVKILQKQNSVKNLAETN